jgi:hypothetical protein
MVKVNAPMMSLDASGKLGGAIVASSWKGRHYFRTLVTPSNPKSGGQVGMRSMLRFLSQYWASLTANNQATWETRAEQLVASPFNAYCSLNLARWRNNRAPAQADPPAEDDAVGTIANTSATAGTRQITISAEVTALNQNWALAIYRSTTTGFSTSWSNCVQVIPAASAAAFTWVDSPLAAGTYYYNFRPISLHGVLGAEVGEVNATVT